MDDLLGSGLEELTIFPPALRAVQHRARPGKYQICPDLAGLQVRPGTWGAVQ